MATTDSTTGENGLGAVDRFAGKKMKEIEGGLAGEIKDIPNSLLVGGPALFATTVPLVFDGVFRFFELLPWDIKPPTSVIFTTFMFVYVLFPLLYIIFKRFNVKGSEMLLAMVVFTLGSFVWSWVFSEKFELTSKHYFWEILLLAVSLALTIVFVLEDHLGWLKKAITVVRRKGKGSSKAAQRGVVPREEVRTRLVVLFSLGFVAVVGLVCIRSPHWFDWKSTGETRDYPIEKLSYSSYRVAFDSLPGLVKEAEGFPSKKSGAISAFQDQIRQEEIGVDSTRLFPDMVIDLQKKSIKRTDDYLETLEALLADTTLAEAEAGRYKALKEDFSSLDAHLTGIEDSLTASLKGRKRYEKLISFESEARLRQDQFIKNLNLRNLGNFVQLFLFMKAERSRVFLARAQRNKQIRYLNLLSHHLDQRRQLYEEKRKYTQELQYVLFNSVQRPSLYIFLLTLGVLSGLYLWNLRRAKAFRDSPQLTKEEQEELERLQLNEEKLTKEEQEELKRLQQGEMSKERRMRWLQIKKGTLTKEEEKNLERLKKGKLTKEEQEELERLQLKKRKLSQEEEDELKELERKYNELEHERGTYFVGFSLVLVLLIPLVQPFSKSDINVEQPMKSFTNSNWYLPHLAKQAVNPIPTEPSPSFELGGLTDDQVTPGQTRRTGSRPTTTGEPLSNVQDVLDAVLANQGLLDQLLAKLDSSGFTVGRIEGDLGSIREEELQNIMDELYRATADTTR